MFAELQEDSRNVICWLATVFWRLSPPEATRDARNYERALRQLSRALRALELTRGMVAWPSVYEDVERLRVGVSNFRESLVNQYGHLRPVFQKATALASPARLDVFYHIVLRVLVEGARMTREQGYQFVATLQGELFGVHVTPAAIRKRVERLMKSPARMLCAKWEMLIFDQLDILPTGGLLVRALAFSKEDQLLHLASAHIRNDAEYLRLIRLQRDLECFRKTIGQLYDPLFDEINEASLGRLVEEIHTDLDRVGQCLTNGAGEDLLELFRTFADHIGEDRASAPKFKRRIEAINRLLAQPADEL
jgi:hypothetical protein